jgi:hypothetical protein
MIRKTLLSSALGLMILAGSAAAQVVVRVGPPAPVVERRVVAPGPGYFWTPGYYRWDGRAYIWAPGAWVRPPRPHAVWVAPRWVHRGGGYVFVEGRWR